MGREHTCEASYNRERGEGKALLETDEVVFRGAFRARVTFASVTGITVRAGALSLKTAGGTLTLHLGEYAEQWAEKIRNPPSRIEKLGVKSGLSVSVLGLDDDEAFLDEVRERTAKVSNRPGRTSQRHHLRLHRTRVRPSSSRAAQGVAGARWRSLDDPAEGQGWRVREVPCEPPDSQRASWTSRSRDSRTHTPPRSSSSRRRSDAER